MGSNPTIVFVDLTGSSAAYESFKNELVAGMVSRITHWVSRVSEAHGGRTVKLLGDGVLLQFPAGVLALSAAIFLQQRYAGYLGDLPDALRLGMKIGMASGSIVQLHADSYGDPVNLAARLCDMAGGHTIWADESVFEPAAGNEPPPMLKPTEDGVRVLSLAEVSRRPLGLIRVPGLTQQRSVFQVVWNKDVPVEQWTRPGNLAEMLAQDTALPALRLSWLDQNLVYEGGSEKLRIGRTADNDLVINDQRVSRQHASIEWMDGAYVLTDLSSYGTTVRFADAAGSEAQLRRSTCLLHSAGDIALGAPFSDFSAPVLSFQIEQRGGVAGRLAGSLPLFDML